MSAYLKRLNIAEVDDTGENIGAYTKRVHIVEMVDADGQPWEPVPGPDPWDDLVVAQEATWSENNVYAVGETISGTSATFAGGTGNETYRSRVQYHSATEGGWTNTPWTDHLNVPKVISGVIPPGYEKGEVRFKTQAIDLSVEPLAPVNSIAPVQSIAPLTWGSITTEINDAPYDIDVDGAYGCATNTPQHCGIFVADAPSDLTYEWSGRGSDNVLIGTPTNKITTITFPDSGVFTITVTLKSNLTAAWESAILSFIVA